MGCGHNVIILSNYFPYQVYNNRMIITAATSKDWVDFWENSETVGQTNSQSVHNSPTDPENRVLYKSERGTTDAPFPPHHPTA